MFDYEKELARLKKISAEELRKVQELADNDMASDGEKVTDTFPFKVNLNDPEKPFADYYFDGIFDWLAENINAEDYRRIWVNQFYFKNDQDAILFKLVWK